MEAGAIFVLLFWRGENNEIFNAFVDFKILADCYIHKSCIIDILGELLDF